MSDETYKGWSNGVTYCVHWWLTVDDDTHRFWLFSAQLAFDLHKDGHQAAATLAEQLKKKVTDENPLVPNVNVYQDLVHYALERVDWLEIAFALLNEQDGINFNDTRREAVDE